MRHVAGALSKFANVVTEPHGEGMRFGVVLDDSDYVEFVLHSEELKALQKILREALADDNGN